jgi:myo-inositol-1(or 4)-monophosphatase
MVKKGQSVKSLTSLRFGVFIKVMTFEKPQPFQLLKVAKLAAEQADQILLREIGQLSTIEEKERAGLVTNVDREAERAIIEVFRQQTPTFSILGEESSYLEGTEVKPDLARLQWVIDPLDGTTNFVH